MSMTKMECALDSLQAAAQDNPSEFQYYLEALRAGSKALEYLDRLWYYCRIEDLSKSELQEIWQLLQEWN